MCGVVCCSALQCVAVRCSVLQCVAVCCSVLQCIVVSHLIVIHVYNLSYNAKNGIQWDLTEFTLHLYIYVHLYTYLYIHAYKYM